MSPCAPGFTHRRLSRQSESPLVSTSFRGPVLPPFAGIALTRLDHDTLRMTPARGPPPHSVQHVTLVLRPMSGVAHTFGSSTHKEIHFSLDHIRNSESRARDEILGVLVHEMVHCFQYNGCGRAPGGLIEGVAGRSFLRTFRTLPLINPRSGRRLGAFECRPRPSPLEEGRRGRLGRRLREDGLFPRVGRGPIRGRLCSRA